MKRIYNITTCKDIYDVTILTLARRPIVSNSNRKACSKLTLRLHSQTNRALALNMFPYLMCCEIQLQQKKEWVLFSFLAKFGVHNVWAGMIQTRKNLVREGLDKYCSQMPQNRRALHSADTAGNISPEFRPAHDDVDRSLP